MSPASGTTPVLLKRNGPGTTWTSTPLPPGIGELYALSCYSQFTCSGLASSAPTRVSSALLTTDDAGTTWSIHAFPHVQVLPTLSCATPSDCVVAGDTPNPSPGESGTGVVWLTTDGGHSWSQGVYSPMEPLDFNNFRVQPPANASASQPFRPTEQAAGRRTSSRRQHEAKSALRRMSAWRLRS